MSETENNQKLAQVFALLSRSAKRQKIYSRQAVKNDRHDVAHLLRAMSVSEAVQARRLFNSMIGRVDTSEDYLVTLFEQEVQDLLDRYSEIITDKPSHRPALLHTVRQLRAAETRLQAFYSRLDKDVKVRQNEKYFVCQFCGYLSTASPPERCPVCTAPREAFEEIM